MSLDSSVLRYILDHQVRPGDRLPTISELSGELGISVAKIREDLEVARTLGLVQVKPRTGTQVQAFSFSPAATLTALYAVALDRAYFRDFSLLRKSIELGFWHDAVQKLTPDDIAELRALVVQACDKLNLVPAVVPFEEHRSFHLGFFKHLENPFVQGLLEAYWAVYKAFGVSLHGELSYHRQVWAYHQRMVDCVAEGDYEGGRRALDEHMGLLRYTPPPVEEPAAYRPVGNHRIFE